MSAHWGQKASVLSLRNAIQQRNLNKTPGSLICQCTLGIHVWPYPWGKAPLNDTDCLHSTQALTTREDVLMASPDIDIVEKWQVECQNEVPDTYIAQILQYECPIFYQDWESIKGVSGPDCLFTAFTCFAEHRQYILATIIGQCHRYKMSSHY